MRVSHCVCATSNFHTGGNSTPRRARCSIDLFISAELERIVFRSINSCCIKRVINARGQGFHCLSIRGEKIISICIRGIIEALNNPPRTVSEIDLNSILRITIDKNFTIINGTNLIALINTGPPTKNRQILTTFVNSHIMSHKFILLIFGTTFL